MLNNATILPGREIMKKSGRNRFYTFMVMPHDASGRTLSIRVPYYVVRYSLLVALISVSVFGVSLLYSTFVSGKLLHYNVVLRSEAEKGRTIDTFLSNTGKIEKELQSVLDENNELRKLLGLKINKTRVQLKQAAQESEEEQPYGLNLKLNSISTLIDMSHKEAEENKYSVNELKERVATIQERMASTPSIWPAQGPITSRFGYRRYPWRGFHTGVDIKTRYGAPIRATAPGIVTYAGWRQGYGRTIKISHGNGFTTLYAHNSRHLVSAGQRVQRGETIAHVGTTGRTTGPHVHYEVRRHGKPINAASFLNLNILSAGRYL